MYNRTQITKYNQIGKIFFIRHSHRPEVFRHSSTALCFVHNALQQAILQLGTSNFLCRLILTNGNMINYPPSSIGEVIAVVSRRSLRVGGYNWR